MPMNTELPLTPSGHVPIGGWSSAAKARPVKSPGNAAPPAMPSPNWMKLRRPGAWFELRWPMLSSSSRCGRYVAARSYRGTILLDSGAGCREDGRVAEEGRAALQAADERLRAPGQVQARTAGIPAFQRGRGGRG